MPPEYRLYNTSTGRNFNPIQDRSFWGLLTDGGKNIPLSKICQAYPAMMKFNIVKSNLKKIQKYKNHVTCLLLSTDISALSPEISNFVISRNTYIDCIITLINGF